MDFGKLEYGSRNSEKRNIDLLLPIVSGGRNGGGDRGAGRAYGGASFIDTVLMQDEIILTELGSNCWTSPCLSSLLQSRYFLSSISVSQAPSPRCRGRKPLHHRAAVDHQFVECRREMTTAKRNSSNNFVMIS